MLAPARCLAPEPARRCAGRTSAGSGSGLWPVQGCPALRFHDLRHSYATWLVANGVPVNGVSRLKGHEQISTTLDRYTHDARDYADLRVRQVFAALAADDLVTRVGSEGERRRVRD